MTPLLSRSLIPTLPSMPTRLPRRTIIQERLEDTTGPRLWSDAALNEYLTTAIRAYKTGSPGPAADLRGPERYWGRGHRLDSTPEWCGLSGR